jgi:broad specificity phosphatase PhoE
MEGLEQIEDVVARVSDFYLEKKAQYPKGRILVVSHGGVSGALHGAIYGIREGENLSPYCLPNTTPVLFAEGQEPQILEEQGDE